TGDLFEKLQALSTQLDGKIRQSCGISTRASNGLYQPGADRLRDVHKHHRDRRRGPFQVWRGRPDANQYVRFTRDQFGRHACEKLGLLIGKAVLERDVAFFDVAELPESLTQRLKVRSFFFDVCGMPQDTDSRLLGCPLLPMRQ